MGAWNETIVDLVPTPVRDIEREFVEEEVLLYRPQDTRAIYLNVTAATIWSLCDGTRSVREIIRLIAERYPEAENQAEYVIVTLNKFQENGVLVIASK
jgi:hypothetical protein